MGCCGEPIENPNPMGANRAVAFNPGAVNMQPNPQQGMQWQQEKQQFQQPNVSTPPPAMQFGQQNLQMQQVPLLLLQPQWNQAGQAPQWNQQPIQNPQWTQTPTQTPQQWQQHAQQPQWAPPQNQAQQFNPYAMSYSPQPANSPTLYNGSSDSKFQHPPVHLLPMVQMAIPLQTAHLPCKPPHPFTPSQQRICRYQVAAQHPLGRLGLFLASSRLPTRGSCR